MFAQGVMPFAQPAEINDPFESAGLGGGDHIEGSFPVGFDKVPAGMVHGVNQVVCCSAPPACSNQRATVENINLHDLHVRIIAPWSTADFGRGTGECPDPVPRLQ